jgi:hypothetical protein
MNIKLCQKCIYQVRYFQIDKILDNHLYFHGFNYLSKLVCKCYTNDQSVIDYYSDILINDIKNAKTTIIPSMEIFNIKTIKIFKSCPYYLEHKLTEWSENEFK